MKQPPVTVQCSAPTQIGYDEYILIGFDQNECAIINEGDSIGMLDLKCYCPRADRPAGYSFKHEGVWYEFTHSVK